MEQETLTKYLEVYKTSLDDLVDAIEAYADITIQCEELDYQIEKKKNELLASGMIDGKNAETRAASLWMQIPEYDEQLRLSAEKKRAQADLEIARLGYTFAKDTFYSRGTLIAEQGELQVE